MSDEVTMNIYEDPFYWDGGMYRDARVTVPGCGAWEIYQHIATLLDALYEPQLVLDVGCGCGAFIRYLTNGIGVDCSGFAVSHPLPGAEFKILRGDVASLIFQDERFDLVVAFNLLEHIMVSKIDVVLDELFRVGRDRLVFSIGMTDTHEGIQEVEYIGGAIPKGLNEATRRQVEGGHWLLKSRKWWIDKIGRRGKLRQDEVDKILKQTNEWVPPTDSQWRAGDPSLLVYSKR